MKALPPRRAPAGATEVPERHWNSPRDAAAFASLGLGCPERQHGVLILDVVAGAVVGAAQPARKVPRIGVIGERLPTDDFLVAFRNGLKDLGHVEGKDVLIEYRFLRCSEAPIRPSCPWSSRSSWSWSSI
jgi:hypothetical protein